MNPGSLAVEMRLVRYGQDGKPESLDGLVVPIPHENLTFVSTNSAHFLARLRSEVETWWYRLKEALIGQSLDHPGFEGISLDVGQRLLQNNRVKNIRSRLTACGEKQILITFNPKP